MKRKINTKPKTICFDIDDTLWRIRLDKHDQVPDYDLIAVMRWFYMNGDTVYVWSAGGVDYAKQICSKLGIDEYVDEIIPKGDFFGTADITFDDEEVSLGKTNIHVQREGPTYEERHFK